MDYYITLPSNTFAPENPSNVTSNYNITLQQPMEFHDLNYEVGLAEIIYCKSWYNIPKPLTKIFYSRTPKFQSQILTDDVYLPITKDVVSCEEMEVLLNKSKPRFIKSTFKFDPKSRRFGLSLNEHERINIHPVLATKLGFRRNKFQWDEKSELPQGSIVAELEPDLEAGLRTIFVYTDIIKSQLVGNDQLPLIRIITPKSAAHGDTIQESFNPIYYFGIARRSIQSINIRLADEHGDNIPFEFGNVIVKLHLRKRRLLPIWAANQ